MSLVRGLAALTWIAGLAAGCTGELRAGGAGADSAVVDVDPTGTWNVEYQFGPACDRPPLTELGTFTVTRAVDGYALAADGAAAVSALSCAPGSCRLAATFTWTQGTARFQRDVDLALDATSEIYGNAGDAGKAGGVRNASSIDRAVPDPCASTLGELDPWRRPLGSAHR